MRRSALIAAGALALSACGESNGPTSIEPSYTIDLPGNDSECGVIDFTSCFAKVDMEFKILYERNNTLSRRGEVLYQTASDANVFLATVFLTPVMSVDEALRQLDRFIRVVEHGLSKGEYSTCAGNQILNRALWLRGKLIAGSVDMSNPPPFGCEVSPVKNITGSASPAGVVLTFDDPYHYTQDHLNTGEYHTYTYFVVERQNGALWDPVVTTPVEEQVGPATMTVTDAATTLPGTYVYRVAQCDQEFGCSLWTTGTVTIVADDPPPAKCPHDNRNGDKKLVDKTKPPCEKDEKEPKDHRNK
ncbi:MAG: hypothetical protein ACT443_06300 [Gemmatimonadota bacterium]